ncbi:MAG: universal stress protein [Bacteroidales bacterium]|nr:universal stress protein [Lentimicrobiaceae bacterium]MDD5694102.1 universal stress protein [Bacteroidales bacterium]
MKKKVIVVAVDFSDCSINAFEHALSIARRSDSDLKMIWVNKAYQERSVALKDPEAAIMDARQTFEEMIRQFQRQLPTGTISYVIKDGKVYREIVGFAEEEKAFLIVVGTHGSSGIEEFWIGSNAQKIVSSAKCPVITIRGGVNIKRDLTRIVLPLDSTPETRQKVSTTALLAKYFNAEIIVLPLYSTQVETVRHTIKKYSEQVAKYLKENEIRYKIEPLEVEGNITYATIEYALKVDANLISIMTEQEKTTKNLWLGPYAQQMVNHSPIPVMSIHSIEFMRSK